jgi:hypothetical protein
MTIVVTEKVSVEEIDEAMRHVQSLLVDPKLAPRRRNLLLSSLDDLLDARLELAQEAENGHTTSIAE